MNFPPDNFEALRQAVVLIKQGELSLHIANKSLSALVLMVNNPDMVATSNITELAKYTKISPASITRLSKLLGFRGYNYFRQVFKQSAVLKTDYYSHRAKKIVEDRSDSPGGFILEQLKSTHKNIQQCLENNSSDDFKQVIKLLAIKRKVYIFGYQQSSALASILRYGLGLIRENVQILGPAEHGLAIAVNQINQRDLLVIFSSSPYSKLSVDISTLAIKRGCQIIAITDSNLSPLHDMASHAINIATDGKYYTNSLAANCILIESLLSLTAIEIGSPAIERLKQHEILLSSLKNL